MREALASPFERDLLLRMHKQLGELLAKLGPLKQGRSFAAASALLGDAYRGLFGLDRRFLQMMQPAQVAAILGSAEKLVAFAQLIAEEADLLRLQGDAESTAAMARWMVRILEEGRVREDALEVRTLFARLRTMGQLGAGR